MTTTVKLLNRENDQDHYQQCETKKIPSIQYLSSGAEEFFHEENAGVNIHLILTLSGSCNVSMGVYNRVLRAGEMTCLAPVMANQLDLYMPSESEVFIFRLKRLHFCNSFPIENLYSAIPDLRKHFLGSPITLKMHERITQMLQQLHAIINDQLQCSTFFDFFALKEQELLYYLRSYYSKQDLLMFFAPVANCDADFADHIYANINRIKSVSDVANITGYSISGVKKKYIKVFGMPFSQWIAREKAQKIYQAITCSRKSFKEIAAEISFSSSSHLDTFCKKHFGMSPGTLRRKAARESLNNILSIKNNDEK